MCKRGININIKYKIKSKEVATVHNITP